MKKCTKNDAKIVPKSWKIYTKNDAEKRSQKYKQIIKNEGLETIEIELSSHSGAIFHIITKLVDFQKNINKNH